MEEEEQKRKEEKKQREEPNRKALRGNGVLLGFNWVNPVFPRVILLFHLGLE